MSARALLGALGVALVLAGCGEREERVRPADAQPLRLALASSPRTEHAPIFAARSAGHLREVGLRLRDRPSAMPIDRVTSGRADLAVAGAADVLRARQRGRPVVAVAALVREPLLVLVADADDLERDGGGVRAFVAALALGAREVRREPRSAVRTLLAENRRLDARTERESLRETTPRFAPPRGRPYGWQDPRDWSRLGARMVRSGRLRPTVDPQEAFTNDYLPGRGLGG